MSSGVYKRTKEHIKRLRKIGFKKGNTPWHTGKKIDRNKHSTFGHHQKHTQETKEKISKANKGKLRSEEAKEKIRISHLGKKSYLWKDGRSKNKKYIDWQKNERNRKKRQAEGSHAFGEWELLKKQYGYKCPSCGGKEPEIKLTEDHIVPLSKGGSDYIENIQPLCKSCNCRKHAKIIKYNL